MTRWILSLIAPLVLAVSAACQTVELPPQLTVNFGQPARIVAKVTDGGNVVWMIPDRVKLADGSVIPALTVTDGAFFGGDSKKALVSGSVSGNYRLWAITAKGDKVSEVAECMVTVVGAPQPAPPPTPPGPTPGPGPGPNPPPTPAKNARVLLVYDKAKETQLDSGQQKILFGQDFRDWLDTKTAADPNGWHKWRIYASNEQVANAPKEFQDMFNRPRASYPWIVIAGDSGVAFEGPLPDDPTAAQALISKYLATSSRALRKAG